MGYGSLALLLPETGQARRGAQLPGLGFLTAGNVESLLKTRFRLLGLPFIMQRSAFCVHHVTAVPL